MHDVPRLTGIALAAALTFACAGRVAPAAAATTQDTTVPPPADHHVHLWSADAAALLKRLQEETGEEVIAPERAKPLGADEVVAALDSAGIRRGVLLSTAYFFGFPGAEVEDEYRKVRAENDYVAAQVRRHPGRLTAFYSVNPLADYALREIERLAGAPDFEGLKLHMANSDMDFRDSTEVRRLREVFAKANELDQAIVIHLHTRREDFGTREARTFVDEVVPAAPDVPIQVAHLGGSGGFDAEALEVVELFARATEEHPERMGGVFFDAGAVPAPLYLARGDSSLVEKVRAINETVAEAVRILGPDRIVYGTDWPAASMPRYLEGVREALPVSPEVFRDLVDDPAPYLEADGGG